MKSGMIRYTKKDIVTFGRICNENKQYLLVGYIVAKNVIRYLLF